MKILVMSDSHGSVSKLRKAFECEQPDACIFLGDCVRDYLQVCDEQPNVLHYVVSGNCDFGSNSGFSERIITAIGGKVFYITHGHNERVKNGYMSLCMSGLQAGADVVLFGHTHMTCVNEYEGMVLLNPGSISSGTYGIITIDENLKIDYYVDSL